MSFDYLKIAGLFVKKLEQDNISKEIVNAIHRITTAMGVPTIAMCVESQEILNTVKSLGINYFQGYYLGQPQPLRILLADL